MSEIKLIADSGSTKTEWCLLNGNNPYIFSSKGMSPYFLDDDGLTKILHKEVVPYLNGTKISELHFFGTGCKSVENSKLVKGVFKRIFPETKIFVENDLLGAAKSLCGKEKGIACILGTGSNSCYFNGQKIVTNSPGIGFILGDEGSGAYLGKKVIQHYLYGTFDSELRGRFEAKFTTTGPEIIEAVYKKPLPNRYLASFALFLAENRGNPMIENIIHEGLKDFFVTHVIKYKQASKLPVHFTGGIAFGFKDVIENLCGQYGLQIGNIYKSPMEGLIKRFR